MVFLQGERVYLRALAPEDVEGNYPQWLNDQEVCRFNSHGRWPLSKKEALAYVDSVTGSRSSLVMAVVVREGDVHIGNMSLQSINWIDRSAEFAVMMGDKAFWGKGYGKEGAVLLCAHGFSELGLHRVHCGTSEDNLGMQGLAASLGMVQEGRRRQALWKHGEFKDLLEYGVLRDEFLRLYPKG